ncbi:MAG: DEAD/DEAH box helicase family protein, partial [Clostridiales bacterium]
QEFLEDKGEATAQELKKAGFSADIIKRMVQKNYLSYREEDLLDEEGLFSPQRVALNDEQKQIFTAVLGEMAAEKRPFLLWGITGSGKTEIYLHLMEKALQEGGQCLFLVPEIALTAQMADNLSRRLSVPIAILHSGLKESEKRN